MHAPRRIKDYQNRLSTAFKNALKNIEFQEEFINLENCLNEKVYGKAARKLGINWYEGTTDKPCDAIHIIGKDMGIVSDKKYYESDYTKDQTSGKFQPFPALQEGEVLGKARPTWMRFNWPGSTRHYKKLQVSFIADMESSKFKKDDTSNGLDNEEEWSASSSSVFLCESDDDDDLH